MVVDVAKELAGTLRLEPSDLYLAEKFIRSRPARFFETIGSRGPDWAVNRFDRKQT